MDKFEIMMVVWCILVLVSAYIIISERKKEMEQQNKGDKKHGKNM